MIRRALVIAVTLMLVLPVLAQAGPATGKRSDARVPSAQLQAAGSGAITVEGRMVVNGTIPDRGQVVVIDRRGDAKAYLAGQPLAFRRGRASIRRASGILFVTGSNVSVQVLGVDLSFSIAGNGRARLSGTGVYRLNSDPEQTWGRRTTIKVSPSSGERRRERRCASCSSSVAPRR
ncbi:MAG: hypothetical protein AB7V62_16400 [Thermoleophilia bacterium]